MNSLLEQIHTPTDLHNLSENELAVVAAEIRLKLIQVTSQTGGHLASSLGATDIIVAMHSIFNAPTDKLVFDTGHQAYAHKLLTGRQSEFTTLRGIGGISGFIRRDESLYDLYDSGHASDALSIAMGLAISRDLSQRQENVVVLIGDAAISGGLAFEALNQIGHEGRDITIILNDNEMSIAHNVGALSLYLAKVRTSRPYLRTRDSIEGRLSRLGSPGRYLVDMGERMRDSAKLFLIGGTLFEDMGITYLGPVDGHSIPQLRDVLRRSQQISGPVLIHALTQKGKGYLPAEADPERFHGTGSFDIASGRSTAAKHAVNYTDVFAQTLMAAAAADPTIVAITAAMPSGTGLDRFAEQYPQRFFDVGIAEQHAVALAAGLALDGKKPVVAIYSSFLQRAFDQLMTNVCLMNLPVTLCLDRAGLVGEDGSTHHGAFDLAYLRSMPNMRIIAPATGQQLAAALQTALTMSGPVAIRYPRGEVWELTETPSGKALPPNQEDAAGPNQEDAIGPNQEDAAGPGPEDTAGLNQEDAAGPGPTEASVIGQVKTSTPGPEEAAGPMIAASPTETSGPTVSSVAPLLVPGRSAQLRPGGDVALLALGSLVQPTLAAAELLASAGIAAAVHNMIWVKPLDSALLATLANFRLIVTLEEGTLLGGFGSAVLEALADLGQPVGNGRILRLGLPDRFITHGSQRELRQSLGLDPASIAECVQAAWQRLTQKVGADNHVNGETPAG